MQSDAHCVDVGANIGLITILLAVRAGTNGHVYAFEPHPANIQKINDGVARYGLERQVTVVPSAVNDGTSRHVTLYSGRGSAASEWNICGIDANGRTAEPECTVPATSLDAYFHADHKIDLVKIDVEGAESQVVDGLRRTIERWQPALIIECHTLEQWAACTRLSDDGYRLFELNGESVEPHDRTYRSTHLIAIANLSV